MSDLSPLVSAMSIGDRLRALMSSLFLNTDHIMGVIQAKVEKDRKPALSTGWDLDMKIPLNISSASTVFVYKHVLGLKIIHQTLGASMILTVMRRSGSV